MAPKRPARRRHVPQRTCIGCRTVLAKRELIRLVRTPDGVFVDPTGRLAGRGTYLHNQRSCWEQALGTESGGKASGGKGRQKDDGAAPSIPRLESALKAKLTKPDLDRLKAYLDTLPG